MLFECHITIALADKAKATPYAATWEFHMSAIEGDEVMGADARAYCTKSGDNVEHLIEDMRALCDELNHHGICPHRKKIEAILLDEVTPYEFG